MKNIGFFTIVALVSYCILSAAPVPLEAAASDADVVQKLALAGGLDKYPRVHVVSVEKRCEIRYEEDGPVIYTRIEINGPVLKPLKHVLKCADNLPVPFSSEMKGKRTIYVWEASDIPAFVSEPGWNTRQHFAARLLASTIASWQEVSRTSKPAMDENDALRSVVAEVTRGLTNDGEMITAILRFLRCNIKYRGLTSVSAHRSKAATQTLDDRFGVCRDVAVLMCSILNVVGIKSFPAATGYNRVFDYEIPHDLFQHMIVAVPDSAGGGYRLFDPTSVLYSGDPLPGYAGEAPLLVCTPEGEDLAKPPHITVLGCSACG